MVMLEKGVCKKHTSKKIQITIVLSKGDNRIWQIFKRKRFVTL